MTYFDANTWVGGWPFSFQPKHDAKSLSKALKLNGIGRALVSSLETVFAPEPGPGNRALLADTRATSGLIPVPVINPSLGNWRDELEHCLVDSRVLAVRLLPSYHGYRLRLPAIAALITTLQQKRVRLIISTRLIDERHEYHALTIKPVSGADLSAFLKEFPAFPILVSGLMRPEVIAMTAEFPQLLADLSFAEWHETLRYLLMRTKGRQMAFASHTPFLITAAARAKFAGADLAKSKLAPIASGNLERFLRL